MIAILVRSICLFLLRITGRLDVLIERANITAIGLSGKVTMIDESVSGELKLKPLNWLERWLVGPYIEAEKKRRRMGFSQAVSKMLGEEPALPADTLPPVDAVQVSTIAAKRRRLEAEMRLERQQRQNEAEVLLVNMPAIPAGAPKAIRTLARKISERLSSRLIFRVDLEEVRKDIGRLEEMLADYERTTPEFKQRLAVCQAKLDELLPFLDQCPECGYVFGKDGVCHCVQYYPLSFVSPNGEGEFKLVSIVADTGKTLARIVRICLQGGGRRIERQAWPVTEPFDDLEIVEHRADE